MLKCDPVFFKEYTHTHVILCFYILVIIHHIYVCVMCTVIGVPLLLAYVYGVVPLSLCRSVGSCGIRTTSSGVRINVNEEEDSFTPGTLSIGPFQSTTNVGS